MLQHRNLKVRVASSNRLINFTQASKDDRVMNRRLTKSSTQRSLLASKTPGLKLQKLDGGGKSGGHKIFSNSTGKNSTQQRQCF